MEKRVRAVIDERPAAARAMLAWLFADAPTIPYDPALRELVEFPRAQGEPCALLPEARAILERWRDHGVLRRSMRQGIPAYRLTADRPRGRTREGADMDPREQPRTGQAGRVQRRKRRL